MAIIVCGAKRTGTSLMMQTLKILGVDVPAPAFYPEKDVLHESYIDCNPNGLYEHTPSNKADLTKYIDKMSAFKFIGPEIITLPNGLVSHLIICNRNRENSVNSHIRVGEKIYGGPISNKQAMLHYNETYECIDCLLKVYNGNVLRVFYENMVVYPEGQVERIIRFLGIDDSNRQLAINNVKRII